MYVLCVYMIYCVSIFAKSSIHYYLIPCGVTLANFIAWCNNYTVTEGSCDLILCMYIDMA